MRQSFKKYLSILLVFTLMLGVIPPLKSNAAATPTIQILGMYTPDASGYVGGDVNTTPSDLSLVTRLTSQKITVSGNYFNFDPSQVEHFNYSVASVKPDENGQLVIQQPVVYDKNPPIVTSNNTFEFRNVVLNEGLNKIVIYSEFGSTSSKAGWVYYHPALTITDLRVNQEPFTEGMIVPSDPVTYGTSLIITGLAPNANSVTIKKQGDSTPYSGYYNSATGYFQFKIDSIDSTKLADIKIDGGDQRFEIVAENDTQKMTLTRSFVYNDGTPITYNNKVATMLDPVTYDLANLMDLITQPVISGSTKKVYMEGDVKVDKDITGTEVSEFLTIKMPYGGGSDEVVFELATQTAVINDPIGDTTANISLISTTATYNIYHYEIYNMDVNTGLRKQSVYTQFTNLSTGINYSKPILYFDYIDVSLPYISEVKIQGSSITIIDGHQITELPLHLEFISNPDAQPFTGVNVYYDGSIPLAYTFVDVDEIIIDWLPEGTHDITFVPLDAGGVEQWTGSLTRSINYIPMQYIIVDNIYNGQIFTTVNKLTQITGRLVNVPDTNTVEAFIGDISLPIVRNPDGTFVATVPLDTVKEGQNIIIFRIKDENNEIIAESIWEIFQFTAKAPQLELNIDTSLQSYFVTSDELYEGQYATRQKRVVFNGAFAETSQISIYIYRDDEFNNEQLKEGVFVHDQFLDTSGFNNLQDSFVITQKTSYPTVSEGTFDLEVDLSSLGTTTIIVQVTNPTGIISSSTYEITREPLPYEIIYPNLERSNIINSNFVRFEMLAEGADSVVFKDGVARREDILVGPNSYEEGFVHEIYNLKPGKNKIKFTVVRGDEEMDAEIEIYNANANIQGAMYKSPINKKIKAFGGLVELEFPKGTMLKRNDDSTINPYLSDQRQILFGIAEEDYGRVDKFRHPLASEKAKDYDEDGNIIDNFYPSITSQARIGGYYITEPTGRFMPASNLYWIDAGTLPENADDIEDIIYGGGKLPYENNDLFYERDDESQIVPTNRGTITLKYNQNMRAESWPYLTIYHFKYNPDTGLYEWENIGGVVDVKSQTITAPIDSFGYFQVMYMNQSFDDVVGHNWARIDLDTLYSKGIMVNKFDDRFVPEQNISRGEFVTLLVKAFELPLDYEGQSTFYDVFRYPHTVGNPLYEYKYVETAARYGIVRGRLEGTFAPDEDITRQDAAIMIARAANLKMTSVTSDKDMARTRDNLQKQFTDANQIDLYAQPAVEAVVKAGLMNGKPNIMLEGQKKQTYRFDPTFELKRSEAARIVMNVLKQQKKIPK